MNYSEMCSTRAGKLLLGEIPFLVVKHNEPYARKVYRLIRKEEIRKVLGLPQTKWLMKNSRKLTAGDFKYFENTPNSVTLGFDVCTCYPRREFRYFNYYHERTTRTVMYGSTCPCGKFIPADDSHLSLKNLIYCFECAEYKYRDDTRLDIGDRYEEADPRNYPKKGLRKYQNLVSFYREYIQGKASVSDNIRAEFIMRIKSLVNYNAKIWLSSRDPQAVGRRDFTNGRD